MRSALVGLVTIMFATAGCSPSALPTSSTIGASVEVPATGEHRSHAAMLDDSTPATSANGVPGAQPRLAADPAQLADDLVADERTLRDPTAPETVLITAARRQQTAYRAIGRHPDWDPVTRPRIPPTSLEEYDRNVDARRQLTAMAHVKGTLPAWRIDPPVPIDELLAAYREAEAASGVGWNYLAAINLIETQFGSIDGLSAAGARGPMQFLPSTFAAHGAGGDIESPRDSIMAAGRYLAANGFVDDHDRAIYRYDNADQYVRAVDDYAAVLAVDPAAFADYHRWNVYYFTPAGDVVLPVGYAATSPIPVGDYLSTHAQ